MNINNKAHKFLLFKVPLSLILIILLFEFIAFCLSDYKAVRHGLDRKVSNLNSNIESYNANILLFGDSVTKDIVDDFNISSDCCNLLNLTTNRASGLLGAYLLYKKYRKNNIAPKYVVISSTPKFLSFFPEGKTKNLYLNSVFNTKEENNIISSYYEPSSSKIPGYYPLSWIKNNYQLTIFNIEYKVIYPLINALGLINTKTALSNGTKNIPPIHIIRKMNNVLNSSDNKLNDVNSNFLINDQMNKLIEDFFTLLQSDNASIFIAWAPLRKNYYNSIITSSKLINLEKYLLTKSNEINVSLHLHDFSSKSIFPNNAFRDQDHLKEGYWKTYYAYLLNKYVKSIYKMSNK